MKIYRELTPITGEDVFGIFNHPDAQFTYPVHRHPEYEINLIMNGSGNRIIGDKMEKYDEIDLVLLGPNLSHKWDDTDTNRGKFPSTHAIVLQFEEAFATNPLLDKILLHPIKKMLRYSVRGIEFFGQTRERAKDKLLKLTEMKGFEQVIEFLNLLNLLAISEEKRLIASAGYVTERETQECVRMDKVYAYIQEHYNRKLFASEVADLVNLSESAFSHFFKKSTNRSFSQYLTEIRVGQACKLLLETQDSIREVCFQCGYGNLSNFNRLFKKYKGMTPQEYRKQVNFEVEEVEERFV